MFERDLRNDGYVSPTTVSDLRDSAITEMARLDGLALAAALKAIGEPHLGAAALICFEWHQRPENVLAGNITWHDYRHASSPHVVKIRHRKTGVMVPLAFEDEEGPFYPKLDAYLVERPRLGLPIVLTSGQRSILDGVCAASRPRSARACRPGLARYP